MRQDYQLLIINHPGVGKDVDSALWKHCFYRQIEEYRKSIRKTVQIIENQGATGTGTSGESAGGRHATADPLMLEKAKSHLARLNSAFAKFLSDSITFYQETMLKVST